MGKNEKRDKFELVGNYEIFYLRKKYFGKIILVWKFFGLEIFWFGNFLEIFLVMKNIF